MKKLRYYFLLLNYLQTNTYPKREELIAYLNMHKIDISERTLYRALRELKIEFGVDIKLDNKTKGYYIVAKNMDTANFVHSCLRNLVTADILGDSAKISFESFTQFMPSSTSIVPIDYLQEILGAITRQRKISFCYVSASKKIEKNYIVSPLFVIQEQELWYLVAKEKDRIKTFKVIAIKDLCVLKSRFRENIQKVRQAYQQSIGLGYCNAKVENVVLSFCSSQKENLKKRPIHNSQSIVSQENSQRLVVNLQVKINENLKQEVLKFARYVRVEKPTWFKEDIILELQSALRGNDSN
ncbi:helix-turn-helix transcriptional regulator [Myroides sp. LJL119]